MAASPAGSVVSAGLEESPTGKRWFCCTGRDTEGFGFFSGMAGRPPWSFPKMPRGLHGSPLGYLKSP